MEIVLVVLVIAAAALFGIWALRRSSNLRSNRLRERFRSEYDQERQRRGRKGAERELLERAERVQHYSLRPLNPGEYERFSHRWRGVQEHFVDNPASATIVADHLVKEVMEARGYPLGDFEKRAADLSVDHPRLVSHYREARSIAEATREQQVSTDDLRRAFVSYRALFDDLLVSQSPHPAPDRTPESAIHP